MVFACDVWCIADVSSVSHASEPRCRIHSNKRPGRFFNVWIFRVGAYSRWTLIKLLPFSARHFQKVCIPSTKQRRRNTVLTLYRVFMIS